MLGEFRRIADGPADDPRDQLTERETEILKMVATGMSYKQIAARLVLSHRTVQNHVQNTLRKLQMNNRVQLTRWAIEHGLDERRLSRLGHGTGRSRRRAPGPGVGAGELDPPLVVALRRRRTGRGCSVRRGARQRQHLLRPHDPDVARLRRGDVERRRAWRARGRRRTSCARTAPAIR